MQALPFSMFIWIRGPFEKVTITLVERSLVTESEEVIAAFPCMREPDMSERLRKMAHLIS